MAVFRSWMVGGWVLVILLTRGPFSDIEMDGELDRYGMRFVVWWFNVLRYDASAISLGSNMT